MIVISGILTAEEKLEQISVKKSPDPQVNSVVTDALSNWTFQSSLIDGKPVALKIMMGIVWSHAERCGSDLKSAHLVHPMRGYPGRSPKCFQLRPVAKC